MNDYISRAELLKAFPVAKADPFENCRNCTCLDSETIQIIVNSVPAADVRPVVLCRECDHWNEWDHVGRETLGNFRCSCAYWSNENGPIYYTGENDFCSYGEPREADHEP